MLCGLAAIPLCSELQCGLATQVISSHGQGATTHTQPSATSAAKNQPDYFSKNLNIVFTKGANLYPGPPNIPTIVLLLAIQAILANLVNLMPIQQPIIDTELIRKVANQFQFPSVRNRRESNLIISFIT